MKVSGDTIVALSSGRLPSAIAIVRASGPKAFELAEAMAGPLPAARHASLRHFRDLVTGEVIDQGLLLIFPAPETATGENIVEFQCHGSRAVVGAILEAMTSLSSVRLAEPGEFTRRAMQNGIFDLSEAEGLADLLEAETEQQRKSAFALFRGGMRRELDGLRGQLLDLSAMAEAAIDYVGDDDETSGQEGALRNGIAGLCSQLDQLLDLPARRPLRDGVRVALAGPTNAGKSSLINKIAGSDRAIVSDIEGTTRDLIEVPLQLDGVAYIFVDTAGIRDSDDVIERIGVERAEAAVADADILLWLGDPATAPNHPRTIRISPKSDIVGKIDGSDLAVSAATGEGLAELFLAIRKLAETLLPGDDGLTLSQRQRDYLSEIREILNNAPMSDSVLVAEALRLARASLDRLVGAIGVEDVLDRLFGRFCLGK